MRKVLQACTLLLTLLGLSSGFVVGTHSPTSSRVPGLKELFGSLDYEYIPPTQHEGTSPFRSDLTSSYPEGTPAGLRGEAIRSALRSRCVGWSLDHGVVKVAGKGSKDFVNNKFTQTFDDDSSSGYKEACLLTARGRIIDRIGIAVTDPQTAYLITSPGHSSQELFDRLDPFIFPMDQVTLTNCDCALFSLASVAPQQIQRCFENFVLPKLGLKDYNLPKRAECLSIPLGENDSTLLIVPTSGLPSCAGAGYTFCFLGDKKVGKSMWRYLKSEDCPEGPVEAGTLEFETLRIESGQPAFGKEMTGAEEKDAVTTPASPLELHLHSMINFEKGCYLGQEGVASLLKNPRGPPRTLYQVVFDDEFNVYEHQTKGEFTSKSTENLTRVPVEGDQLFVLGSNEAIAVGQITSVAEPAGTGEPVTLALALVRRSDSIQKQMKSMNLKISRTMTDATVDAQVGGSGLIPPPPRDPLDGLEVIVGGTYTVGILKVVPSRRGRNMFDNAVPEFVENLPREDEQNDIIDVSQPASGTTASGADNEATQAAELAKAEAEAEAAAAEAKRKAEKLEMLRKRAEEAMLRRKQKKAGK